jgi:hypothetical protein
VAVDEGFLPQIAQPDQIVRVSAPSPAGWHLVRLTDTPIQIVAIYLFMTLVLPAFLLAINDFWPVYYRYESFSVIEGIVVIGAIILACTLRHAQWAHAGEIAVRQRAIFIYSTQKLRIVGLLFAIVVAIINVGNSGFRYDELGLSQRGSFSLYVYAVIPACVKLLLIYHAFVYRGTSPIDRLERALVTTALAVSINGNATAFVTVFSFLVLQTNAVEYLFRSKLAGASYLQHFAVVGVGMLLVGLVGMILGGAYVYGESIKRDESMDMVLDSLAATWTPDILIEIRSSNYASLVNTLPLTFDFKQDHFDNLGGVWNTLLFRLEALHILDSSVARESTMSIARLNFEFITQAFALNDREGTSPGLIPGFLYCFPPILNLLMLGAYVFMVLGILQRLCLCMKEELSFIGKFILTYFTLLVFESPIDFLVLIDDAFIFFVGLWWMSRLVEVRPTFSTAWEAGLGQVKGQ